MSLKGSGRSALSAAAPWRTDLWRPAMSVPLRNGVFAVAGCPNAANPDSQPSAPLTYGPGRRMASRGGFRRGFALMQQELAPSRHAAFRAVVGQLIGESYGPRQADRPVRLCVKRCPETTEPSARCSAGPVELRSIETM